ncbi:MAG TPA: type I restriction endonuclease [bacterium]|nr:type I restriction endonuclease [bacterium]
MKKLAQNINDISAKLDKWRRRSLNEASTRTIIIEPILEALGWDIRDPDEVGIEYPTVDKKAVDYALKINKKPILLIEAKALNDPLEDVKAITQIIGYATSDGIVWCVLTNGVKWKVYRSVEKCPAPDKLMFEVSLDLNEAAAPDATDLARQLWRVSREEIAKGTLDEIGERTFTDGKVRKAIDKIMRDPPRRFINLIKNAAGDENLKPQKIKESLTRVWAMISPEGGIDVPETAEIIPEIDKTTKSERALKSWETRRRKRPKKIYTESRHIEGKPAEVLELYRKLDNFCFSLKPGIVNKQYIAKTINYLCANKCFCSIHILRNGLRVWLYLKYNRVENPPPFSRDVSNIGHWGGGDFELGVTNATQLEESFPLIRQSFETRCR